VPGDGTSTVGMEVNGVRRHHGFGSATNAVLVWFWFWLSMVNQNQNQNEYLLRHFLRRNLHVLIIRVPFESVMIQHTTIEVR
jgi:hypothetical protein